MNDEMIPPAARDTEPPEPGEGFRHGSTLPPFASDERVTRLEAQHSEVMGALGEIRGMLVSLIDGSNEFRATVHELEQRVNRLAGRVAVLDGQKEGKNGNHRT